jgi:DNA (cytosine-5)-methyltransferase 1
MESPKTFCEFFAGIGLVGEGLRPSGWRCIYANDIDPDKRQMYVARNGPSPDYHLQDIRRTSEVVAQISGHPFMATASFPCIDMSLAGHYRGFKGEHSSTFFAFVDVLGQLSDRRPATVFIENVTGFVTARQGKDFILAVESLAALGYWLDAIILDARHFVPQSRPRVFLIGVDDALHTVVPQRGWSWSKTEPDPLRPPSLARLVESVQLPTGWLAIDLPMPPKRVKSLSQIIEQDGDQDWWSETEVERHYRMMSDRHRQQVDELLASGRRWVSTIFRRVRHEKQRAEVRFDGLAGCLRTPSGGSAKQIVIMTDGGRLRMRWMTPREYARLQGVADFPLVGTRNQLLWGFADAVCVPVIEWIDAQILTPIYIAAQLTGRASHARQSYA